MNNEQENQVNDTSVTGSPLTPTTDKFQVEVLWKEGTTEEQKDACAEGIKDILKEANETDNIPEVIQALTFRRTA